MKMLRNNRVNTDAQRKDYNSALDAAPAQINQ
jgi:hypothetical protein